MNILKKEDVKYIVVHCTATRASNNIDVYEVNKWHLDDGYEMIGYHYLIKVDGTIEHGRPLFMQGAHVKGCNDKSIGVCYVGGLDDKGEFADTRNDQQRASLWALLIHLKHRFPKATIVGHHDLNRYKACPCFDAKLAYAVISQM